MVIGELGEAVCAQAQFNLYRTGDWVTLAVGFEKESMRRCASGYYNAVRSPRGDYPVAVRVRRASDLSEDEAERAWRDIAQLAGWSPGT